MFDMRNVLPFRSSKLSKDILWNIMSFVVIAVSGGMLNLLIAKFYSPRELGVFNQTFALYIILTQLAVLGVHHSMVKYGAQHLKDQEVLGPIIFSAVFLTFCHASVICLCAFLLQNLVGIMFDSPVMAHSFLLIVPGVLFASINKVLIGALNGMRRMKAYAVLQALRLCLYLAWLCVLITIQWPGMLISVLLSAGEICLFLINFFYFRFAFRGMRWACAREWCHRHLEFGLKAFLGGALYEMNTRVDVLLLGIFSSDYMVGIYSFAAILVEGFVQLMFAVRATINPVLTQLYLKKNKDDLIIFIQNGKKVAYPVMVALGLLAIIAYPLILILFLPGQEMYWDAWPIFMILMFGMMFFSGYYIFSSLLAQAGFAGKQTCMIGCVVAINIVLNIILIPPYKIYGAAIATSISFIMSVFILKYMVRKALNISL